MTLLRDNSRENQLSQSNLIHILDYLSASSAHVDKMKLLYVAALLVPTILAADVGARDTQLTDAQPVQGAGGLADVQKILKEEVQTTPHNYETFLVMYRPC